MKINGTSFFQILLTVCLFAMTLACLTGQAWFAMKHSCFSLLCGFVWLLCTSLELPNLIENFIDTRKQRRLRISLLCGTAVTLPAFQTTHPLQLALAGTVLFAWTRLMSKASETRAKYRRVERGLAPKDTWLDPPADAFQVGDVVGTTGVWWEPHQQSFAHCEMISSVSNPGLISNKALTDAEWDAYLARHKGTFLCASSCSMEYGTYIHSCEDLIKNCLNQVHMKEGHERWFCARLTEAGVRDLKSIWGKNWQHNLNELVLRKLNRNKFTRRVETLRRRKVIDAIPFLQKSQRLDDLLRASGYNWCKMAFAETEELVHEMRKTFPGFAWLLFGYTNSEESDLCSTHVMSLVLEDLKLESKVKKNYRRNYTPFGFGNPVLPVEVLLLKSEKGEPYFRLLNHSDREKYKLKKLTALQCESRVRPFRRAC